jgi:hypothetical protein
MATVAGSGGDGSGVAGLGGDGGSLNIGGGPGGDGAGTGDPGDGGSIAISASSAGSGGSDDARGGQVTIQSGTPSTGVTSTDPGGVFISTKSPNPAGLSSTATRIRLASTTVGGNIGAQVVVNSATAGTGGGISLLPGTGVPAVGTVTIGKMNPGAPGMQFSNVASLGAYAASGIIDLALLGPPAAPLDTYIISFNIAFAAAPSCIQITLAQDPGSPPLAAPAGWTYNVHSILPGSFAITVPAGWPVGPGGFGVMWAAYL